MRTRAQSVLVVAPEPLSAGGPGPSRRAAKLAEVLGNHVPVTLAAPSPSTFPDGPFETLETGTVHDQRLAGAFASHEITVVQLLHSPRLFLSAIRHTRRLVFDSLAPIMFEAAADPAGGSAARAAMVGWRRRQLNAHLAAADFVLCTNERQRELLAGMASSCPIAVVPHGIDDEPPRRSARPLREAGVVGIEDQVAIWAGGLWPWLDPLTPVQAVERLHAARPGVRLVFAGAEPEREASRSHAAREVLEYVRARDLEGGAVVFVPGRLGRQEYLDHLFDADAGVSAHPATIEARYATRTRILDYLEAGLSVACTRDEAMADFVDAHELGAVAAPSDPGDFAVALEHALARGRGWDERVLNPLRWTNAAQPLVDFCLDPDAFPRRSRGRAAGLAIGLYAPFLRSVYRTGGAAAVGGAALRRARHR